MIIEFFNEQCATLMNTICRICHQQLLKLKYTLQLHTALSAAFYHAKHQHRAISSSCEQPVLQYFSVFLLLYVDEQVYKESKRQMYSLNTNIKMLFMYTNDVKICLTFQLFRCTTRTY